MKKKFKDGFLCLDLMLFLILTAIFITIWISPLIHQMDVSRYQLDELIGLDKETIKANYAHLSSYLWLFHRSPLELPNFAMSMEGAIHFADVKRLVDIMQIIWIASGTYGIYQYLKSKDFLLLKNVAMLLVVVPSTLGFLAACNFSQAFIFFHHLLFSNEYWIFDYRQDPVILILPEEFFMHCFFWIVGIVLVMAGLLLTYYKVQLKKVLNNSMD